jgi:hypothetical protein
MPQVPGDGERLASQAPYRQGVRQANAKDEL